ncbi:999_t:CDS:1 [Acaulospora morrowiae]|uniref:999_t:CDS:1 n=1 Tax=Acaulospora morrowiae TaxID=94023 RepID=A0A9N8VP36_9GLOM|nr:999_t:CDS:1 [Acaulospora morrowiae]
MLAVIFIVLESSTIGKEYFQPSLSKEESAVTWNSSRIGTNEKTDNFPESKTEFHSDDEKYITYLPHSGLNNQRIELQNAITVAYLLNRTLILPPLILGSRLAYADFDRLTKKLAKLSAERSKDVCERIIKKKESETNEESIRQKLNFKECEKFHDAYALYRWDRLFDFKFVRQHVRIIHRKDFNDTELYKTINIEKNTSNAIYYIKHGPHAHRFFEHTPKNISSRVHIDLISDLRNSSTKLIYVASFFGPKRVVCQLPTSCEFIKKLQKFVPSHPVVHQVVNAIVEELGGRFNFMSAHARVNDGHFMRDRNNRVNRLINKIKVGLTKDRKRISKSTNITRIQEECTKRFPDDNRTRAILYLATDAPPHSPTIQPLIKEFPCTYTLSDFSKQLEPLLKLKNTRGGDKHLGKFLMPVVDLMVAANGGKVYILNRSTFGSYLMAYHRTLGKAKS